MEKIEQMTDDICEVIQESKGDTTFTINTDDKNVLETVKKSMEVIGFTKAKEVKMPCGKKKGGKK